MSRLTIEMPTDLGGNPCGSGSRPGDEDGTEHLQTDGVDEVTRRVIRWVDCWATGTDSRA